MTFRVGREGLIRTMHVRTELTLVNSQSRGYRGHNLVSSLGAGAAPPCPTPLAPCTHGPGWRGRANQIESGIWAGLGWAGWLDHRIHRNVSALNTTHFPAKPLFCFPISARRKWSALSRSVPIRECNSAVVSTKRLF